jgi:hypothetical protein
MTDANHERRVWAGARVRDGNDQGGLLMTRTTKRAAGLAAVGGIALNFGGCLGGGDWWQKVATDTAVSVGYEFLLDNDSVFDLFQDDYGTGVQFDDRFTAAPSRDEPDGTVFPRN